jgi:hypothetical protein
MVLTGPVHDDVVVPYLSRPQIRRAAAVLLDGYSARFTPVTAPPVPVEEILEIHLGLTLEIADLRELFGVGDVLGAIWMGGRTVRIDASLDPSDHPALLGRYRYTQAHEAGHWCLHRRLFLRDAAAPAFVCRSGHAKRPVEWQADYFAAQLLMPSHLLRAAWEEWHGSLCPAAFDDPVAAEQFVRPLAHRFEVSAEPMRIRLEELELLPVRRGTLV